VLQEEPVFDTELLGAEVARVEPLDLRRALVLPVRGSVE
jgi:hypothetical protein